MNINMGIAIYTSEGLNFEPSDQVYCTNNPFGKIIGLSQCYLHDYSCVFRVNHNDTTFIILLNTTCRALK